MPGLPAWSGKRWPRNLPAHNFKAAPQTLASQSLTLAPATPIFGGDVIAFSKRNLSIFTAAIDYKFGGW
jgi:hypothetical protein